jgi:hypothetical protein
MSGEQRRWHVPTSDELEQAGAILPAPDQPGEERRGGLRRFFRVGRFRVSEEVAAKKRLGRVPANLPPPGGPKSAPAGSLPVHTPTRGAGTVRVAEQVAPAALPRRRTIRIDQSVKDRRGMGHN